MKYSSDLCNDAERTLPAIYLVPVFAFLCALIATPAFAEPPGVTQRAEEAATGQIAPGDAKVPVLSPAGEAAGDKAPGSLSRPPDGKKGESAHEAPKSAAKPANNAAFSAKPVPVRDGGDAKSARPDQEPPVALPARKEEAPSESKTPPAAAEPPPATQPSIAPDRTEAPKQLPPQLIARLAAHRDDPLTQRIIAWEKRFGIHIADTVTTGKSRLLWRGKDLATEDLSPATSHSAWEKRQPGLESHGESIVFRRAERLGIFLELPE